MSLLVLVLVVFVYFEVSFGLGLLDVDVCAALWQKLIAGRRHDGGSVGSWSQIRSLDVVACCCSAIA
ncbi:hypothetical protein BD309DRAFT_959333 [Dichomitus squalens]|nr:hypothetical protein BD309DRAFT_959333 [Dichomitus squalens]